jgi:gamma-glutamylcyclotransferase (GGCT)/AIG2-like uncharacterized protein YtfP
LVVSVDVDQDILLFSYGTLQQESVQRTVLGRQLQGRQDAMLGYVHASLEITDESVVETSGSRFHPIAIWSGRPEDEVSGIVLRVTGAELAAVDRYEVSNYKRVLVDLKSGARAWAYVKAQ